MEQVFLSLGSNLGDRPANLRRAVAELGKLAELTVLSSVYETEPVEFTAQPWFLNAVVAICVDFSTESSTPQSVLGNILAIERSLGRQRIAGEFIPKGPRVIDIDVLLVGSRVIQTPSLTVPHPAMHLRRFVLEPLVEIAPEVEHPVLHQSALKLLQALPLDGPQVRRVAPLNL